MRAVLLAVCVVLIGSTSRADDEVTALVKNLKSKDVKTRLKAVEGLAAKGEGASGAAAALCAALYDNNSKVALAALSAIENVRPDLYKPISKVLLDRDARVQAAGLAELGELGERAKPATVVVLNRFRREAARAMPGQKVLSLDQGFFDCLEAFKKIKADDDGTIGAMKLLAGTAGAIPKGRLVAMEYLVAWAGTDAARRKELVPLIRSGMVEQQMIVTSIGYAGQFGKLCTDMLPTLRKLKLSDQASVRNAAEKAIGEIEAANRQ